MANLRIDQLTAGQALTPADDLVPVYQPSATIPRTRYIAVEDIANLNASAIATAQAAAQAAETTADAAQADATQALADAAAAQATADAAIPLSQKGAANGVATLDASGKVPASQLTLVSTAFKGNWDATANSPALTDGTGTGGDFYFVQNGTTRNLGSGNVAWTTGALIIHDGTKWVENEAVNNVLSVAGKTGAVTLVTNDVTESTDKNYVTDDYLAAMANANAPSASNPFLTEADGGGGGGNTYNITINGGENLVTGYGDGVNTVGGTGTSRTLSSLGYTNGTAATQWPLTAAAWGGITAASTEYDEVSLQEALLTLAQNNYLRKLSTGTGILNIRRGSIIWPSYKEGVSSTNDSKLFHFDGQGCLFNVVTGAAPTYVFTSNITSQTEALNSAVDNVWRIENFKIEGQGSGTGMRLGASRSVTMINVHFKSFDTGFIGGFLLNALYQNCTTSFCNNYGFFIDKGWWSGAGYSTAGNQPLFVNCRFRTSSNTAIGLAITGADSIDIQRCTFEGSDGNYGIWIDNSVTTVAKNINIDTCRWEIDAGNKFASALIYAKLANGYTVRINQPYNQTTVANSVLLEMENVQGTNIARIENCIYSTASGSDRWQYKNVNNGGNGGWIFDNAFIQGNPQTAADVVDTINFPNIWAAGSDVPNEARIRIPVTRIQ